MNELTKEELQAQLTELGVPFNKQLGKVKLQKLLDEVVLHEGENEPVSDETPEGGEDVQSEPETAPEDAEELPEPSQPTRTADYVVVTPVKYQGTRYLAEAKLRLNPEIAIPLLDGGAIQQA